MKYLARIGHPFIRSHHLLSQINTSLAPVHQPRNLFQIQTQRHASSTQPSPASEGSRILIKRSVVKIKDNPRIRARKKHALKTGSSGSKIRFLNSGKDDETHSEVHDQLKKAENVEKGFATEKSPVEPTSVEKLDEAVWQQMSKNVVKETIKKEKQAMKILAPIRASVEPASDGKVDEAIEKPLSKRANRRAKEAIKAEARTASRQKAKGPVRKVQFTYRKIYDVDERISQPKIKSSLAVEKYTSTGPIVERGNFSTNDSLIQSQGAVFETILNRNYARVYVRKETPQSQEVRRIAALIQASASKIAILEDQVWQSDGSPESKSRSAIRGLETATFPNQPWEPIKLGKKDVQRLRSSMFDGAKGPVRKVQSNSNEKNLGRQEAKSNIEATERIRDRVRIGAALKTSASPIALLAKQVWRERNEKPADPPWFTFRKAKAGSDPRVLNILDEDVFLARKLFGKKDGSLKGISEESRVQRLVSWKDDALEEISKGSDGIKTIRSDERQHENNLTDLNSRNHTRDPKEIPREQATNSVHSSPYINDTRFHDSENYPTSKSSHLQFPRPPKPLLVAGHEVNGVLIRRLEKEFVDVVWRYRTERPPEPTIRTHVASKEGNAVIKSAREKARRMYLERRGLSKVSKGWEDVEG